MKCPKLSTIWGLHSHLPCIPIRLCDNFSPIKCGQMLVTLSLGVLKRPVSNMQGSKALKNGGTIHRYKESGSLKYHTEESNKSANQEHLHRTVTREQNTNLHVWSHWNSGVFITLLIIQSNMCTSLSISIPPN